MDAVGIRQACIDAVDVSVKRFHRIEEQDEFILRLAEKLLMCAENLARCAEKRR